MILHYNVTYIYLRQWLTLTFDLEITPVEHYNLSVNITLLTTGGTTGYQILAPAYYDQNGQLVMGNGRGIGTPVRLVSPAPILVNATAGQQGKFTDDDDLSRPDLPTHTTLNMVWKPGRKGIHFYLNMEFCVVMDLAFSVMYE